MADALTVPQGTSYPVKEECPVDGGVSDIPAFTKTRQPAQSAPGSTFALDVQGSKLGSDDAMPASTTVAALAPATTISDGLPVTPFSLSALPATPPSETIDFDAEKDASASVVNTSELPATRPASQLMNDTPSDSASEPHSEQAQPEQPAVRMYRFRPEFIPARRSPPGHSSRDDRDSPEPLPRRASINKRKSSRNSLSAGAADGPESPLASPDSAPTDHLTDGSANELEHSEFPQSPFFADDSLASKHAPLSPSTAADASDTAAPVIAAAHQTPSPEDRATLSKDSTRSAADDSIATRRPMRAVRQAKPVVAQETPQRTRPTPRSTGKADANSTSASPAPRAMSARKAPPTPKSRLSSPPPVERRVTRRSGLPLELAVPIPEPAPKGKRRRSESDKNLTRELPRELLRLQDTKEYKHVDDDPVVYTVWSNGKFVPCNAAGEPLPDKTKRVKSTKDAATSKTDASAAGSADAPAEEVAPEDPRPPQRRLKKWLPAGLYAGQAMPKNPAAGLTASEKKALAKYPELTKTYAPNKTLPMPIYNGLRILLQGRDFKLPFDVFNPLPPGQPKPVKFGKFNKNRFVGEAHAIWKKSPNYDDLMTKCVCKPETGCDDDCQNRIMLYECNDAICNVGAERCNNREFQKLAERTASKNAYNIGVEVFKTPNRGHGIRASRGFAPGQIIMEYIGEIITEEESDRRMNELYKNNECYYLMSFDQSLIIDGTSGSVARFVNHSCDPNCRMIKWLVSGQPRIALFAGDRPIQTGEELTYDYNFDPYSSKNVQSCLCGSENCRGILGPRKSEKAVSKAAAAAAAAAAAEKAASEKAKSGAGTNQKKPANGASKRKHDVYSIDAEDDDLSGAPAAKKMRSAPGQQQNTQAAKKASKAPAPKAIMTTKAALELLAAEAAKKARLEKASKAAKAARAAKAAKAAEERKAAEAAEAAAAAEAAKKAKATKAAKSAKSAKATTKASPTKPKASATTKATKAKPTATKTTKPIKVVKAVQSVKVVKTAKGLKASKTSTESKAAKAKMPARKTAAATKTADATGTKSMVKIVKPAQAQPAKAPKSQQKPKTSLAQKASTATAPAPAPASAPATTTTTTHQATPMAQAVAGPAKAGSPAKAHKSVKFVKKARSQAPTKPAAVGGTVATGKKDGSAAAKKAAARRRQVPKKVVDLTPADDTMMGSVQSIGGVPTVAPVSTASTPSITDEEDELAAQLYLEVASNAASKMTHKAKSRTTASKGQTGRISKPAAASAKLARRGLARARKVVSGDDAHVSEEIEDVSMFDDGRMLLDEAVTSDSAMDTIHVAPSDQSD